MVARLRWLMVVAPIVVIGIVEIASDTLLDEVLPFPLDAVVVSIVVGILAWILVRLAFRRVDSLNGVLERRNADLEARATTARSLHRLSLAVASLSDLDPVLDLVVSTARDLLGADVAALLLAAPDGSLGMRAASGDRTLLDGSAAHQADDPALAFAPAAVLRVSSPLRRVDESVGHLVVAARTERSLSVDDVETLGSLANLAAVALENDRLSARLRDLAVVEERERIAREMHDGLAQVLGYVNTKSQAVEGFLESGHVREAQGQLAELAAAARSLYVDVREAILGLRSPIVGERGLVAALEGYAARFAEASKLAVVVEASPAARELALTPPVQAHIFRIVQEGLTNVRKHAAAQRASVSLVVLDDHLVVRLADDGRGIVDGAVSPSAPAATGALSTGASPTGARDGWPHFGLAAMRERAATIDARIGWREAAGGGAEIELVVPLSVAG